MKICLLLTRAAATVLATAKDIPANTTKIMNVIKEQRQICEMCCLKF